MADLADIDALKLLLGLDPDAEDEDDQLQLVLDQAETAFETATNRTSTPFRGAQTGRIETQEGHRVRRLLLDYAPSAISEILLGLDFAEPDETLDSTDVTIVRWQVGSRELLRTDGGTWTGVIQSRSRPDWDADVRFVRVTYNAQADLPVDAAAAVLQMAATLYRQTASAGVKSESLDNYSVTYGTATTDNLADSVPGWRAAVAAHHRLTL